jgi:hypothetical protein
LKTAEAHIDYDTETLSLNFQAIQPWLLHKIEVSYNGRNILKHSFASKGSVASSGVFNQIDFEFSIAAMKIMFYSSLKKEFTFEIVCGAVDCGDEAILIRTT